MSSKLRKFWLLAFAIAGAGCDSRASATDPAGGRADPKSKEYESCGATLHCQDELRCFDHTCRRTARSTVGDYFVALGTAASTAGEHEAAIAAFESAAGHYQTAGLQMPPDVDCAYGAALAAAREVKKAYADRGARVLHRCVLGVPGGALRDRALANLALLGPLGLDPLALGADKPADTYLTKAAAAPSTDKLEITVSATPNPTGKSYPKVPEALQGNLRPALIACWEQHLAATKKAELAVAVTLKVGYVSNPDYEGEGGYVTRVEAGSTPEETCVKAAIEKPLKGLRLTDSINSKLAITIK